MLGTAKVLLLLICMQGDTGTCAQFPVEPPAVISEDACAAQAQSEFAKGIAKTAEDDPATAKLLTLDGYFCGYLTKLQDGRAD